MKTYLKLLSYAPQIRKFLVPFWIFLILHVIFGQLNFVMIMPLLDILFGNLDAASIIKENPEPLGFSIDSIKNNFQFYLAKLTYNEGPFEALKIICGVVILSSFISNLSKHLSDRILETIRATFIRNLRKAIFDHLITLNLGFFASKKKGDILSRMTSDMQEVEGTVIHALTVYIRDPITLIGFFVILFSISVELTLYSLIIIPTLGGLIGLIINKLRRDAQRTQESLGQLVTYLEEAISGLRVIKAFNAQGFVARTFNKENQYYSTNVRRLNIRRQLTPPLSEFMGIILVSTILIVGGTLVLNDDSSLKASGFIAYLAVFSQVIRPAKSLAETFSSIQRSLVAGERILEIKQMENPIKENPDAKPVPSFEKSIHLDEVTFSYGDQMVLHNINLEIPKGKMIALVGPSGAGKSTIADLIPRFYDPVEGSIKIDGQDLRNSKIESVRNFMGIVPQEAILFHDTIFNNITFGKDVDQEEVERAARIANAHEFISQSEEGYQTIVGDRGMKLSGGQRQRISIARAVLANPPILILDEATSALDTESEKLVQEALNKLMENRTSLVIAHRLSTIQKADAIVVLDQGRIVEQGTHEDLIKNKDGLYSRLSSLQGIEG